MWHFIVTKKYFIHQKDLANLNSYVHNTSKTQKVRNDRTKRKNRLMPNYGREMVT
jgi:hypothetical protein